MLSEWIAAAALLVAGMDQPARGFVINGSDRRYGVGCRGRGGDRSVSGRSRRPSVQTRQRESRGGISQAGGRFSLALPYAGEFYIVGLPQPGRPSAYGHRTTFHSSARTVAEATPVRMEPGMPAVADIVMLPAKLATVSGVVLGSDGRPVPNAQVVIARGNGFFGLPSTGFRVSPTGTFRVGGPSACLH